MFLQLSLPSIKLPSSVASSNFVLQFIQCIHFIQIICTRAIKYFFPRLHCGIVTPTDRVSSAYQFHRKVSASRSNPFHSPSVLCMYAMECVTYGSNSLQPIDRWRKAPRKSIFLRYILCLEIAVHSRRYLLDVSTRSTRVR